MKQFTSRITAIAAFLILQVRIIGAQVPTHLPPGESEPVPFTLSNIIVFIVLPVALFIFYIWWLKEKKKKREEELKKKSEEERTEDKKTEDKNNIS